MKLEISTTIEITATYDKVWAILTDFEKYPHWNPFIKSITGNVTVGKTITAMIEPPKSNAMTFKPKILTYIKNRELSWLGHLIFPGLFDGKHKFELIENLDNTTTFIQSEQFSGILVFLFQKKLNNNTKKGFILMNEKLKELAESDKQ